MWRPLVHLDAKTDAQLFRHVLRSDLMTRRRVSVRWGGLSSVMAARVLLDEALERSDCTHFYLMSGQCYPIRPDCEIEAEIRTAEPGRGNWMTRNPMPRPDKPIERYTERWANDLPSRQLRIVAGSIFRRLPTLGDESLLGMKPFGGSAWWLLERSAAQILRKALFEQAALLRKLRFAFIPDEWLPHTILSHFGVETTGLCPTATLWREGAGHPLNIDADNIGRLPPGPQFLARKFVDYYPDGEARRDAGRPYPAATAGTVSAGPSEGTIRARGRQVRFRPTGTSSALGPGL